MSVRTNEGGISGQGGYSGQGFNENQEKRVKMDIQGVNYDLTLAFAEVHRKENTEVFQIKIEGKDYEVDTTKRLLSFRKSLAFDFSVTVPSSIKFFSWLKEKRMVGTAFAASTNSWIEVVTNEDKERMLVIFITSKSLLYFVNLTVETKTGNAAAPVSLEGTTVSSTGTTGVSSTATTVSSEGTTVSFSTATTVSFSTATIVSSKNFGEFATCLKYKKGEFIKCDELYKNYVIYCQVQSIPILEFAEVRRLLGSIYVDPIKVLGDDFVSLCMVTPQKLWTL